MFDHKHYVPVLRWKRAEWVALRNLDNQTRTRITPLIEFVPRNPQPPSRKVVDDVLESWGNSPFFADFWLLDEFPCPTEGADVLSSFAEEASAQNLWCIPVTGIGRSEDYRSAVRAASQMHGRGVCVRLWREDLQRSDLARLLTQLVVARENTDLVVDYQVAQDGPPDIQDICSRIPSLGHWRTFSLICGAFPRYLSELEKNRQHELPRCDWLTWRDQVFPRCLAARSPAFGDYTIQHARYSVPPPGCNPSASIRYTSDEKWVIMRGEGIRNVEGPGRAGYRANAILLCGRQEFCGRDFSYGDQYIEEMAEQNDRNGSPETWLRAGVNHHLTFAARQISSLF
ncbi:MAG: beta family protein [Armatimonadetes bacterium]|nr:beta family protein [Armatimonadota bacterium]